MSWVENKASDLVLSINSNDPKQILSAATINIGIIHWKDAQNPGRTVLYGVAASHNIVKDWLTGGGFWSRGDMPLNTSPFPILILDTEDKISNLVPREFLPLSWNETDFIVVVKVDDYPNPIVRRVPKDKERMYGNSGLEELLRIKTEYDQHEY